MKQTALVVPLAFAAIAASPAAAAEAFGGLFAHHVSLAATTGSPEGGTDF